MTTHKSTGVSQIYNRIHSEANKKKDLRLFLHSGQSFFVQYIVQKGSCDTIITCIVQQWVVPLINGMGGNQLYITIVLRRT